MTEVVIEKIIEMFIILMGGAAAYKARLVDADTSRKFSNLLLLCIGPLLIFQSYQVDFDERLFYGILWTLLASTVTFAAIIILSELLFRGKNERRAVEKIASIYSNCGFIGIPLINGIFGAEGILYMTAYTTVFNLLFWTHGVWVMGGAGSSLKSAWRNLVNPAIIAVIAGFICFTAQIRLPEVLSAPVQMVASMNTPLAMIVAGVNVAQGSLLKSMKNLHLYYGTFVKLLVFPVVGIMLLAMMHLDFHVAFTIFIAMACPAGAVAIMFAERYGKDARYASEFFVMSTALSALTIPLLSVLASSVLG